MKNTRFEQLNPLNLPPQVQLSRMRAAIVRELTVRQRQVLMDYYFRNMTMAEIAAEQGIHKSTVCRTLHRAENRLRRVLRY